ncbi:MAG: DUF5615 family PIN-like protein [Bryobacteraceae bacterium]|nr:DUF5615 family PIN-like protein [Bryobacteraceae bacterium]
MKFKIDENMPSELAVDLRDLGHEADTVFDEGQGDPSILGGAVRGRAPAEQVLGDGLDSERLRPANRPPVLAAAIP